MLYFSEIPINASDGSGGTTDPKDLHIIAICPYATTEYDYFIQHSRPIYLSAGKQYTIHAVTVEETGTIRYPIDSSNAFLS